MKKIHKFWLIVFTVCCVAVLALYGIAQYLRPEWLMNPDSWLDRASPFTAVLGTSLLALDVFLPTPSSVIMTSNGFFFGFELGGLLNFIGLVAGGIIAFLLGRIFYKYLQRFVSLKDQEEARKTVRRYGMAALILSRPIPIMAEAVAVTAAASGMKPWRFALGIALGSLPLSFLYAFAGANMRGFTAGAISFLVVVILSGFFWWRGSKFHSSEEENSSESEIL